MQMNFIADLTMWYDPILYSQFLKITVKFKLGTILHITGLEKELKTWKKCLLVWNSQIKYKQLDFEV